MIKPFERKLLFKILLVPCSFVLVCWLYIQHLYVGSAILGLICIYQLYDIFRYQRRIYTELEQFREAIYLRDFSRHYNVNRAPAELKPLRQAFNTIGDSFKDAAKEKETHYQYLQQILAIINTGILSFNLADGSIVWMNEALRNMINLPQLKNISGMEKRSPLISKEILMLPVGESKLMNLNLDKSQLKILLSATAFQIDHQKYKLVTFQNISETIEETEADAWSRLLRVMTHEIMNSIAPISSLASTLNTLIQHSVENNEPQPSYLDDLKTGIDTIGNRSEALLKFAGTYRNLNKISNLNLEKVYVRDLFESQGNLMAPTLSERNIELEIILKDPSIQIEIDRSLVEQVLINLMVNAIEAVKEVPEPKIVLTAEHDIHKKCIIRIKDNGPGIAAELLDKVFIPFFSTKKNGSGIGLNLCRQIMMLHKGSINVQTIQGAGTGFSLVF